MLSAAQELAELGILGMNCRNGDFVSIYNQRKFYPLVDDKLKTKQLALQHHVAVPELFAVVEIQRQVRDLSLLIGERESFVIKPSRGSGGEGILVIRGKTKKMYRKASGTLISLDEMKHHVSMILGGVYSLGGHPDKALIEYAVEFDPVFEDISFSGVPDIRIIVFLGIPVMAMIRLPTKMSDGKANLHQGAIGAGIDLRGGKTLSAVWQNEIVEEHPDTGAPVQDVQIPRWDELLLIATKSYDLTQLGYQGVDIVLDKTLGPLLLELNARPGLNIQIANRAGLLPRLRKVEECFSEAIPTNPAERIAFSKEHFGVS